MKAYPLAWPPGWKRTDPADRTAGKFYRAERVTAGVSIASVRQRDLTLGESVARLFNTLRMFGVIEGDAIVSSNLQPRLDGAPRSDRGEPADPGVAVYWRREGEPMKCMAIDRYARVRDNIAAVAATLEAMRAIERHGGALILERAFQGFDALPAPGGGSWSWREAFGFEPTAKVTLDQVERSYRTLRSAAHPDRGGDAEEFDRIQRAWEMAQQELRT